MAKIEEIKLHKATDWRAIAADLMREMPAAERKALVEKHTPRADATVTMHTKLSYDEAAEYTRQVMARQKEAQKAARQGKPIDGNWATISFFVKDWSLQDVETGEPLPFTQEGFGRADMNEAIEVAELCARVAEGRSPNA